MVMSTCAHGYIVSIDTDEALHMPGVVSYISVDDVIGNNSPDAFHNREVFSTKEVGTKRYPAKPSYSHCVKLGRTDDHFSTAARVKKDSDSAYR